MSDTVTLRVIRKVVNGEKVVVKMQELSNGDLFFVDDLNSFYRAYSDPYITADGVWGIECDQEVL